VVFIVDPHTPKNAKNGICLVFNAAALVVEQAQIVQLKINPFYKIFYVVGDHLPVAIS
jgi:hypothetical protein